MTDDKIDVKIVSKDEAFWLETKEAVEKALKNSQNSIKEHEKAIRLNREILDLAILRLKQCKGDQKQ